MNINNLQGISHELISHRVVDAVSTFWVHFHRKSITYRLLHVLDACIVTDDSNARKHQVHGKYIITLLSRSAMAAHSQNQIWTDNTRLERHGSQPTKERSSSLPQSCSEKTVRSSPLPHRSSMTRRSAVDVHVTIEYLFLPGVVQDSKRRMQLSRSRKPNK